MSESISNESSKDGHSRKPREEARRISTRVAICLSKAFEAGQSRDVQREMVIEALQILRVGIKGHDGQVDQAMIAALRNQILRTNDTFRMHFLEWVIAHPDVVVTLANVAEVMRDPQHPSKGEQSPQMMTAFYRQFIELLETDDPGVRLSRLEHLRAKIRAHLTRDKVYKATGYEVLITMVEQEHKLCLDIVRGALQEIGRKERIAEVRALVRKLLVLMDEAGDEGNQLGRFTGN